LGGKTRKLLPARKIMAYLALAHIIQNILVPETDEALQEVVIDAMLQIKLVESTP